MFAYAPTTLPNIALILSKRPPTRPIKSFPLKPINKNPIKPIVGKGGGRPLTKLIKFDIDLPIKLKIGESESRTPAPKINTLATDLTIASPICSANFSILPKFLAKDFSTNSALVFKATKGEPSMTAI